MRTSKRLEWLEMRERDHGHDLAIIGLDINDLWKEIRMIRNEMSELMPEPDQLWRCDECMYSAINRCEVRYSTNCQRFVKYEE